MLLYDGSPYHPSPTVLLQLAQAVGYETSPLAPPPEPSKKNRVEDLGGLHIHYRVSIFGTSPRYLADLRSYGIVPRK